VQPETKYARNGEVNIAYQVVGDGPRDLVLVPGFVSHLDLAWTEPSATRYLTQLASFARLIIFDKRGTGLSDPVAGVPTLEERMDDVRAVMDAAGSEQAAVYGISEGGPMAALFAATYPERTEALVMYGTIVRGHAEVGHPLGLKQESYTQLLAAIDHGVRAAASRCSRPRSRETPCDGGSGACTSAPRRVPRWRARSSTPGWSST
jgi:pimeloyl-ACP methyl ester carboxylesterase